MSDYGVHTGALINYSHAGQSWNGLTKDAAFAITFNEQVTSSDRGIKGTDRAISVMGDRSGKLTVQVLKTSPLNSHFANLAEEARRGNVISAPIEITGDNGNVIFYDIREAVIESQSDLEVSANLEGSSNSWVFDCNSITPKPVSELNLSASAQASLEIGLEVGLDFTLDVTL